MKGNFYIAIFFFKKYMDRLTMEKLKEQLNNLQEKCERYQPGWSPTAKVLGYHEYFFGQNMSNHHFTVGKYYGLPELGAAQIRGTGGTARLSLYAPHSNYDRDPVISSR